jgi:hypothetical protein
VSTATVTTTTVSEHTTTVTAPASTTQVSGLCTGQPCPDLMHCRSQWGWCGLTEGHCNSRSIWTQACQGLITTNIETTTVSITEAHGKCMGEPCPNAAHCRSKWGWCGSTGAYCNDQSAWTPDCARRLSNLVLV